MYNDLQNYFNDKYLYKIDREFNSFTIVKNVVLVVS